MHTVKKRNEDILFMFTVKVLSDAIKVIFDNDENVQMKKSMKNSDTVKSMKNNNTVLLTENDDIVKSINYNNFMNMTSESFTHITID